MKENIGKLISAIAQKEKDQNEVDYMTEYVLERLDKFTKYFNSVYRDVISMEVNSRLRDSGRITQEDFEFRLLDNDKSRRIAHEAAIDACNQLNRACQNYNVPEFCPTSNNRHEIADFVGKFVYNVYENGIGEQSLDKAIEIASARSKNPENAYNKLTKEQNEWSR